MSNDPRYVDDPFEEEEGIPSRKPKKLMGKTDLQLAALKATGRTETGFRDNKQYNKFHKLEENTVGATDDDIVWKAWFMHRIKQAAKINMAKGMILISMDKLIHNIGLEQKREEWFIDNRAAALQASRNSVKTNQDMDEIEQEMLKRKQ